MEKICFLVGVKIFLYYSIWTENVPTGLTLRKVFTPSYTLLVYEFSNRSPGLIKSATGIDWNLNTIANEVKLSRSLKLFQDLYRRRYREEHFNLINEVS